MRKLLVWLLVFAGLSAAAQEVRVTVEITNIGKLWTYEIELLTFTRDGKPVGAFPVVPSVPIPPGQSARFGPYSLKEEPNDLWMRGKKLAPGAAGTFEAKFDNLMHCRPADHQVEQLRVHLTFVTPTVIVPPFPPLPIPPTPPIEPMEQAVEEGWARIKAGIEEAIRAYAPILKETRLTPKAAMFWSSGGMMLAVVPADPIVLKPEAIIGLIFIEGLSDLDAGFYVMYWPPKQEGIWLLSPKGEVMKTLRAEVASELLGKAISNPKVDIITSHEPAGPEGILKVKICIGYRKPDCTCIGIYIELF